MFTATEQGVRRMLVIFSVFLIGIMLPFSQGCVSKKAYNTMIDERDDCQTEKELLRMHADSVESANELLHNKLVIQKTGTAVIHALYEELVSNLKSEIMAGQITIEEMKSGLVLNLPEEILFPSGSNELTESGRKMLMKMGAEFREVPYRVLVAGFTDNVSIGAELASRYPSNWDLAGARASSVVRMLEESGVAKEQMRAISAGENMPIASNETPEGRAKNRRIEIRIRPVIVEE
ncbi:MAG: OmpA family protein [Deltaproteobacteria bacterium]|nr:OmpA family protein [Deltaproteobacteria bacterium]